MPGILVAAEGDCVTTTTALFLPHALPGFIAWLREQAGEDEVTLLLLDLHKMVMVTPDYWDWGRQIDRWHVADESPDLAELKAGRLHLMPGLFELHCKECRAPYPCKTVRLLTARYKDRPGFENGWSL
jgi:hypothetical protein